MGSAKKTIEETTKLLNDLGGDFLMFEKSDNPFDKAIEKFSKKLQKNLLKKKSPRGSGNLFQLVSWGDSESGWNVKVLGKNYKITLELPYYYIFTDEGRKPTRASGNGKVRKALSFRGDNKGWIARAGIARNGMRIKQTWKLKDGTIKSKWKTVDAKEGNRILSFMISKKIHEKGFKGDGWFSKEVEPFKANLQKLINDKFAGATLNLKVLGKK